MCYFQVCGIKNIPDEIKLKHGTGLQTCTAPPDQCYINSFKI